MDIRIPASNKRTALFVIDVQPKTLNEAALALIPEMAKAINVLNYDAYVEANYYADDQSMFYKQGNFKITDVQAGLTAKEIKLAIESQSAPKILVTKNVRSCFKAHNANELHTFLRNHRIEEVHFIGFDINDCVLASAYEAIDLGYFTYVIEELCHHWELVEALKEAAIAIYRRQAMSNNSYAGPVKMLTI